MKLLKNKINCPYACVDCQNWKCEECEIFKEQRKKGNKILKIENNVKPPKMAAEPNGSVVSSDRTEEPQQIGAGTDEISNKVIDYILKEIEELKEENKELKEKYKKAEKEYNKEFVEKYGIYPGADEP